MFYFGEIEGKRILKSDLIKNAEAFFTTRDICICYKSEDIQNDVQNTIESNKKIICDSLKIERENLLFPTQTHTSHIEIAQVGKSNYPDTDGIILTNKEQTLYLNFADC